MHKASRKVKQNQEKNTKIYLLWTDPIKSLIKYPINQFIKRVKQLPCLVKKSKLTFFDHLL